MSEEEKHIKELAERFESSLESGDFLYFDVEDLEDLSDYYFQNSDILMAEKVAEVAEKLHPVDDGVRIIRARMFIQKSEYEKAIRKLNEVSDQSDVDVLLFRGRALLGLDRLDEAINVFNLMLDIYKEDDDFASICLDVSDSLCIKQQYAEAFAFLLKADKIAPKNQDIIPELVYCSMQAHMHDECIRFSNELIDMDPYSTDSWCTLGQSYVEFDEYDKALDAYEYALAIAPDDYAILMQKGLMLYLLERLDEAVEVYEQCVELAEEKSIPLACLAECYSKKSKYYKAYETYKRVMDLGDESSETILGMGLAAFQIEKFLETIRLMDRLLIREPDNVEAIVYKAEAIYFAVCFRDSDSPVSADDVTIGDAKALYLRALGIEPDNFEALRGLGRIEFDNDNYDKAVFYFSKAVGVRADDYSLLVSLAVSYYHLGDEINMVAAMKKALELSKDSAKMFFDLCPEAMNSMRKYL